MEARTLTTRLDPVELLQALIRNACVNDGRRESGQEVRNADALEAYLGTSGIETESFEAHHLVRGRRNNRLKMETHRAGAQRLAHIGTGQLRTRRLTAGLRPAGFWRFR